jgi:hypothetical protein
MEVFEKSGGPEQSLLVLAEGDHMIFSGSRGQLGDTPKREIQEEIIRLAARVFWDAYLKDDAQAKEWLTGGGFARFLGAEGEYRYRR